MTIRIISEKISKDELTKLASEIYGDFIKGVVDLNRNVIALGGEMHADAEETLLKDKSRQCDLWGFNINLNASAEDRITYESFINIRPRDKNTSLEVQDASIRAKMKEIICERIDFD